jgi:thiamine biosynthesis protein ThiS
VLTGQSGGAEMEIEVNSKAMSIPDDYTVSQLLNHMKYPKSSAVFVNGRQMLFREYDNCELNEKDIIKIIRILGGG